jgi:ADP-ribosylation factor related protein 1
MFSLVSGFFRWLVARDEARILIIGLDGAGKTTLLEHVKAACVRSYRPPDAAAIPATLGMNLFKCAVQGMDVTLWDVGGSPSMRGMWAQYFGEADGIVFVVDAADRGRFPEAAAVLASTVENTAALPVLVLANKQDSSHAARASEVEAEVCAPAGLGGAGGKGGARPFRVLEVRAQQVADAKEALDWITKSSVAGALERQ